MKTFKELKDFCEKNNVRYELNAIYSKPYEYPAYENGKWVRKESRTLLGYEFGMNNIAGRKGKSEWQWTWFETIFCVDEIKDDDKFFFRARYSMVNGKEYKGWREDLNAENTIERRMA